MPLYTAELDSLKKELIELRRYNSFYGFEGDELNLTEYKKQQYKLSKKVASYVEHFKQEQWKDIASFLKNNELNEYEYAENTKVEDIPEISYNAENALISQVSEENYFNAPELELVFDQVNLLSYHDVAADTRLELSEKSSTIMKDLDRIFTFEIDRIKGQKSSLSNVVLIQKISKVQEKIRTEKINEASVLMSRFYNENKNDITLGYLYSEILFAKAGLGNQKSLSKARNIANTVCFLTDRSDDALVSYYRYLYVCREFCYDKDRALQLLRDFVLLDPEKMLSSNALVKRNGFYLKCLLLFLRFDIKNWNPYEIESMQTICLKSVAGGVIYLSFLRNELVRHLDSVRYGGFLNIEHHLYNIKVAHEKIVQKIQTSFTRKGLPKTSVGNISTVGQKYLQNFLLAAKIPTFSDYITNTSLLGVQYIESTKNDKYLSSLGMGDHSLWRAWISKITSETSLQRADIIPVEQVLKESKILSKYENLINRAHDYEMEIYKKEEYDKVRELLSEITSAGIIKVILGENKYSVFDYGSPWSALKEYYNNLRLSNTGMHCQLATELLQEKGKLGLFWNLEELQMMLEAVNLVIDNKTLGLKARLDNILEMKDEQSVDDQYMTLSEHLEMYWWVYILMLSLLIFLFNMIS